jgi:hypothetical protein
LACDGAYQVAGRDDPNGTFAVALEDDKAVDVMLTHAGRGLRQSRLWRDGYGWRGHRSSDRPPVPRAHRVVAGQQQQISPADDANQAAVALYDRKAADPLLSNKPVRSCQWLVRRNGERGRRHDVADGGLGCHRFISSPCSMASDASTGEEPDHR